VTNTDDELMKSQSFGKWRRSTKVKPDEEKLDFI
jgi:hypothetical protein